MRSRVSTDPSSALSKVTVSVAPFTDPLTGRGPATPVTLPSTLCFASPDPGRPRNVRSAAAPVHVPTAVPRNSTLPLSNVCTHTPSGSASPGLTVCSKRSSMPFISL